MPSELDDYIEHIQRYRAVTLQALDIVSDDELDWRPDRTSYSIGQHLVHIAHAEDMYARGLFENDWDFNRVRLPKTVATRAEVRQLHSEVRSRTMAHLQKTDVARLSDFCAVPTAPTPITLRSWLWFVLEHEIHHKAQVAVYLKQMGHVAPFYVMPLPLGTRPDIAAREELGGF
jgi:uncharacterized damage-inducible protein DinB